MRSQSRLPYRSDLVENVEVRMAVQQVFGRVCAYCEALLPEGREIRLGHHRPRHNAGDANSPDGHLYYAWLSYDWDNILPVCEQHGGQRHGFPVEKGARGTLGATVSELREQEAALLLDPCHDDPSAHLEFDPTGAVASRTSRGRATIDLLDLDTQAVDAGRRRDFQAIADHLLHAPEGFRAIATGLPEGRSASVIAMVDRAVGSAGAFSLALLKHYGGPSWRKDHQIRSMTPGSYDASSPSQLGQILAALVTMPLADRRKLLAPFLDPAGELAQSVVPTTKYDVPAEYRTRSLRNLRVDRLPAARAQIASVAITNFKALEDVEFSLPAQAPHPDLVPCMLILGENATGKSSVLEAIAMALLGTSEIEELDRMLPTGELRPSEFAHRPDMSDWDRVSDRPLSVRIGFKGLDAAATLTGGSSNLRFGGTEHSSKVLLAYGPRRFFSNRHTRRLRAPAYRVRSLFDPMAVIANPIDWLLGLEDDFRFDAAVRALRVVLMLGPDAKMLREDGRILIDTPQGQTPLSKLSVGYKSVVALAVDIIREMFYHFPNLEEAYGVVIIDEIETHLHPRWKMRIVRLLREAFPRIQFVMTTHDPLCLRGMFRGEVFVLRRDGGDARVESLQELPDVQGMRAEQILTSEFFGLGSTDPETDAKIERYQDLTRRSSLTEQEQSERERLAAEVERTMMVGDTLSEQTDAAAMVAASALTDIDAIPLAEVRDGDRERLIREKLVQILGV